MFKRILLITGLFMVIFGTSCFAEKWVDVPNNVNLFVDLDSVNYTTINTDNIVKCRVALFNKDYSYQIMTDLIDTDNSTFCVQLVIAYDFLGGKEKYRVVNDIRVMKNWSIYKNNGDISAILKTIQDNQRAD